MGQRVRPPTAGTLARSNVRGHAKLLNVNSDTKAIIGTIVGTGLAVIAVVVTLVGGVRADMRDMHADMRDMHADMRDMHADMRDVRAEIRDMRTEIRDMRAAIDRLDDRLDAVGVALDRVVQRLLTLERLILPSQTPR